MNQNEAKSPPWKRGPKLLTSTTLARKKNAFISYFDMFFFLSRELLLCARTYIVLCTTCKKASVTKILTFYLLIFHPMITHFCNHNCRSFFLTFWYCIKEVQILYIYFYKLVLFIHTSTNFISMVVTRAISNFRKIHTFLICRMQKWKKMVHHWTWLIIWKWHFLGKFCQISTFRSGNQHERLTQFITLPVPQTVIVTR